MNFIIFGRAPVLALNFSANWRYFDTSEEKPRWTQTYSLILSSWATNALSTNLSLRYTRQDQAGEWRELYTPVLALNLTNDWFNLNFSATATENRRSDGPDLSTRSWDSNLTTSYQDYNWRFYYGQASQKDDRSPHRIDTDSDHWGISVSKEWNLFGIYADYRGTSSKDHVDRTKTNTDSYFVKGDLSNTWKKFRYSFSQQITYTKNKWKSSETGPTKRALISISVSWHLADTNQIQTDDYIIIDTNNQEIDLIIFYADGIIMEELDPNVKWKIEWSNDQSTWTEIANNVSLPYEFPTTFNEGRYLKLTVISGTDDLNSPVVRAYKYLPAGVNSYTFKSKSFQTNASLGYNFDEKKNIAYNFFYNKNIPKPGKNSESISQNITGYWYINKLLQTTSSFSTNRDKTEGQKSKKNYNFSINIISDFLETLTTTTTYTHSLNKEGNQKISTTDTITLSTAAELYPDLESRWDINYTHTKNFENDSKTDSINTHINLTARLKPSLTITAIYDFTHTKSKGETSSSSTDHFANTDIIWRPSETLLIRGSESIKWGKNQKTIVNSTYSLWVNINPKIQINLLYSGTRQKGQNSDRISSNLSWDISRYLFFKTTYSWEKTKEEKRWAIMFSLTLTF